MTRTLSRPEILRDGEPLESRVPAVEGAIAGILWMHGGGMFLGRARQDDGFCGSLASDLGVSGASVDYRLAPEHPHPEPLDDRYAALEWMADRYPTIDTGELDLFAAEDIDFAERLRAAARS